jgi:hypothetical protein
MEQISAAGNTEVPAYLTLVREGFRVQRQSLSSEEELWIAERGDLRLSANSPLELPGLFCMRQKRGADWKAAETEIDTFQAQFYPDGEG